MSVDDICAPFIIWYYGVDGLFSYRLFTLRGYFHRRHQTTCTSHRFSNATPVIEEANWAKVSAKIFRYQLQDECRYISLRIILRFLTFISAHDATRIFIFELRFHLRFILGICRQHNYLAIWYVGATLRVRYYIRHYTFEKAYFEGLLCLRTRCIITLLLSLSITVLSFQKWALPWYGRARIKIFADADIYFHTYMPRLRVSFYLHVIRARHRFSLYYLHFITYHSNTGIIFYITSPLAQRIYYEMMIEMTGRCIIWMIARTIRSRGATFTLSGHSLHSQHDMLR